MDGLNIDLSKIKKEHILIGCVVLIVLIIFLAFRGIFSPLLAKTKEAVDQIEQKQGAIARAKVGPESVKNLKREVAQIKSEADFYQRRLEGVSDVSKILRELNSIAERQKIKFISVTPLKENEIPLPGKQELLLQIPIRIKLQCSYHELGIFINQIENHSRLMKVTDLKISANKSNIWAHQVELAISSYSLVSK